MNTLWLCGNLILNIHSLHNPIPLKEPAMATTRPSIYSPSIWAFNGWPIIRCPSSGPNLAVYLNRHAGHFPRVGVFRLSQITERTNRKRQPMRVFCSVKKLSEIEAIPLSEGPKLPSASGIYAVHDKKGELQFIGISRRIAASVLSHLQDVPDLCGTVKIAIVDEPDRTALTDAWKLWMEEHIEATGKVPPGNESGNTTWIRKQRRVKQDLRLTPGRHVKLTLSLEQLIDKLVKENEVVVFIKGSRTAPQCGFSHKVLTILNEQGVDYESVNVFDEEYNPGLREALKVYSKWPTFPQVFVRGELIGGADILTEMAEKGELRELLKK